MYVGTSFGGSSALDAFLGWRLLSVSPSAAVKSWIFRAVLIIFCAFYEVNRCEMFNCCAGERRVRVVTVEIVPVLALTDLPSVITVCGVHMWEKLTDLYLMRRVFVAYISTSSQRIR